MRHIPDQNTCIFLGNDFVKETEQTDFFTCVDLAVLLGEDT